MKKRHYDLASFSLFVRRQMKCYTVICRWHAGVPACDSWQTMAVVLEVAGGAQDAANEACLFLIWRQPGMATAILVIEGHPPLYIPFDDLFDAQDYDETITFGAKILAVSVIDDVGSPVFDSG